MYFRASLAKPVKPQTNLTFLTHLVGRLDLTRFSIYCVSLLCFFGYSVFHSFVPHITNRGAGGSLTYKSMLTHIRALPNGDPTENRTPVSSVRGSRPRPLDDGAIKMGHYIFIIASHARPKPWHCPPRGAKGGPKALVIPLIH